MPKAYWVVTYRSISNPEAMNTPVKTYESGMNQRVVLIEFDSVDQAIAAHDSAGYKEALKALGTGSAERDVRVVEGI
jgi:uncharacterized protein (DUF1330 family)